jgi:hypothetical protein
MVSLCRDSEAGHASIHVHDSHKAISQDELCARGDVLGAESLACACVGGHGEGQGCLGLTVQGIA